MNIKLGIAPIGWTNDDLPELGGDISFTQCINEMAEAGFEGCEVGNKFPKDPKELNKYLKPRKMVVCNQWFSYEMTNKPLAEIIPDFNRSMDFLSETGAKVIGGGETANSIQAKNIPILHHKVEFTEKEWVKVIHDLNELGKLAYDQGMKLAFHHHMGTGVQSLEETMRLMDATDPKYVYLNYDCGHFRFAGEDPVAALDLLVSRVAHVHLKDVRLAILQRVQEDKLSFLEAVKKGVFTVPGDREGHIDFDGVFKILNKQKYDGWLVVEAEQDPSLANPLKYAKIAKEFLDCKLNTIPEERLSKC